MLTFRGNKTVLANVFAFSSLSVSAQAEVPPVLADPGLRNPFAYAALEEPLRLTGGQGEWTAQLPRARLSHWQITDLVLVGTIAQVGAALALVKAPDNKIHMLKVGDVVTRARLRVLKVEAGTLALTAENSVSKPRDLSLGRASSVAKVQISKSQFGKDDTGLVRLQLRPTADYPRAITKLHTKANTKANTKGHTRARKNANDRATK